jgi:LmbE family N-acetylglucosaminyl deacetylase
MSGSFITRGEFLLTIAGAAAVPKLATAASPPKVLIVVAHPDDEYTFAATVYRITHELKGTVDQVVITNGEGGYRYSQLAESVYGVALTKEDIGRKYLPAIRKEETLRAGKILGIRNHFFLDQKDARFTLDGNEALARFWDTGAIVDKLNGLLESERYDYVFTLLPTAATHGHHQAATLLALEAVAKLPVDRRPAVFGSEPAGPADAPLEFTGRDAWPLTAVRAGTSVWTINRERNLGFHDALNYNIIVNWVIAEHKSQGLFQTDCGKHNREQFWLFDISGRSAPDAAARLFAQLNIAKPAQTE